MGPVSQSIKTYGRRAGYKVGGVAGTKAGGTIGAAIGGSIGTIVGGKSGAYALGVLGAGVGERLGRRAGHKVGRAIGGGLGSVASKTYEKIPILGSMSKGGPIRRTGLYRLHKGEYVVSKAKAQKLHRVLRRRGNRGY